MLLILPLQNDALGHLIYKEKYFLGYKVHKMFVFVSKYEETIP